MAAFELFRNYVTICMCNTVSYIGLARPKRTEVRCPIA